MITRFIVTVIVVLSLSNSAHAGIDDDYKDHRIYITYTAMYRMYWCLNNPTLYAAIAKDHPDAAPALRDFLIEKVKTKMNLSAAILVVDFASDEAFFKMTDDLNGFVSPQPGWQGKTRKIALLADMFLHKQQKVAQDSVLIASEKTTVLDAWTRLSAAGKDPYVAAPQTEELAEHYVHLTKTSRGLQEIATLTKLHNPQMPKMNAFLNKFGATNFDRLHIDEMQAARVEDELHAHFHPM